MRVLSFFLDEHCKNESSLLLLDLRSIRSGGIGEIGPEASNFMDDFSQRDWTVMGFQFKRGPQRRSKAKIEFLDNQAAPSPHTDPLQSFQVIISH